jgi:hypothetical protein
LIAHRRNVEQTRTLMVDPRASVHIQIFREFDSDRQYLEARGLSGVCMGELS